MGNYTPLNSTKISRKYITINTHHDGYNANNDNDNTKWHKGLFL